MTNRSLATGDSSVRSFLQSHDGDNSERTFLTNLLRIIRPQRKSTPRMLLREFAWDIVTVPLSIDNPVQALPHRADRFAVIALPLEVEIYGLSPWSDIGPDSIMLLTDTGVGLQLITVEDLPGLISEEWWAFDPGGFIVDNPRVVDIYKRSNR